MFAVHPLLTPTIAAARRAERERLAHLQTLRRTTKRSAEHPSLRPTPLWRSVRDAPSPSVPSPTIPSATSA